MKYFDFLNVMFVVWCGCVGILIHAGFAGYVDYSLALQQFIELFKEIYNI
tara:strand:- start:66 stop:215 length:150 start_codon:yes stop_codon:yes gene_type:complete